ncbi:MAG TPA: AAA family ATPase [Opitutaceae bacterium]|jgi:ABC-type lipoprotein export system ATPase subunit|nr:AAA family ATPase [Opitutaceae bacterium]
MADPVTPPPVSNEQMNFLGTEFEAAVGANSLEKAEVSTGTEGGYFVKSLHLANFKGFVDFTAHFGRFNVIVGANNSGKSTLLRAIKLAHDLTRLHLHRYKGGCADFYSGRSVPKTYLPVAQLRDLWPAGKMRQGNEWIPAKVELTLGTGHTLSFGIIGPWNAATSKIDDAALKAMNQIPEGVVKQFIGSPPEFVPASIGIVAEEEYRTPARQWALASTGRHNEIIRNYLIGLKPEQLTELAAILAKYFGANVEIPPFDSESDQFISVIYKGGDAAHHDLYSAGGGFLQIVEVLAFIFRGSPGVILLDEPDSHLHSSLQHALVDILEALAGKRLFQVLMATHSKEIINYVDPSRLLPVDRRTKDANALAQETSTVTILKELGVIDNVDAYQIVKQGLILAVEGPSDRELLPRLTAKLGETIFDGSGRVSILPAGGVDKLIDGTALKMIEQFLGRQVRCVLLRDRDGISDEWLAALQKKSVRPLLNWPLDCLESYLVCPPALHRIIVEEMGDDKAPKVEEINSLIATIFANAENRAKDRVSAKIGDISYRLEKKRLEPTATNPMARDIVDAAKKADGSVIRYAHGKELLSEIRQAIQQNYKVSFGNARIIEAMKVEEIHPDVTTIMAAIRKELFPSKTSSA